MRVLTVSSLYPSAARPAHGVFVENRMSRVAAAGVDLRVIAPLPWFPFSHDRFGAYGAMARTPARETRQGVVVDYPRYPTAPGMGFTAQPYSYFNVLERAARRIIAEEGPFDLIDAHYFYPDGVAAAWLADRLNLPLTITARGSDVNQIPDLSPRARRMILTAAARADRIATVCEALRAALIDLGADQGKITTLRNGVDLEAFRPLSPSERAAARARYGVGNDDLLCVSVGGLVERKGCHLTIEAIAALPGARLIIAGEGPERRALEAQIQNLGAADRIHLAGLTPHSELRALYGAADFSILASSREGWANVLLESMACGTPVVATNVWGAPEVITSPVAGRLIEKRDAADIASAVAILTANPPPRAATRLYAERFGWEETVGGVIAMFEDAIRARQGSHLRQAG